MPPGGAGELPVIRSLTKCEIDCGPCPSTQPSDIEADGYVVKNRREPAEGPGRFRRLRATETCGLRDTLLLDLCQASIWRADAVLAPEFWSQENRDC